MTNLKETQSTSEKGFEQRLLELFNEHWTLIEDMLACLRGILIFAEEHPSLFRNSSSIPNLRIAVHHLNHRHRSLNIILDRLMNNIPSADNDPMTEVDYESNKNDLSSIETDLTQALEIFDYIRISPQYQSWLAETP